MKIKFNYLEDGAKESFARFSPPKALAVTFYGLMIILAVLAVFWPWGKNLLDFIRANKGPLLFSQVSVATLIIYSYIQLRCGRRELTQNIFAQNYGSPEKPIERPAPSLQNELFGILLHSLFLFAPALPFLILAASISGISFYGLFQGIVLLFTSALLFRMLGFFLYVLWGKMSIFGYFVGRLLFAIFFFVTPIYVPTLSTLRILYAVNKNMVDLGSGQSLQWAYRIYLGVTLFLILFIAVMSHMWIQYHLHHSQEE